MNNVPENINLKLIDRKATLISREGRENAHSLQRKLVSC